MPSGASAQVSVTFDDIAVCFSEEEWKWLDEEQKELYKEVMRDNYEALISLGKVCRAPDVLLRIKEEEEEEPHCSHPSACEGNENNPSPSTSLPLAWSFGVKHEEEPYPIGEPDADKEECVAGPTGNSFENKNRIHLKTWTGNRDQHKTLLEQDKGMFFQGLGWGKRLQE
ncbi:zinc finger protein 398-like isoform X2 [Rhinatrema bivittatum]|uniref:zinc finger protein 398-like isoform X2 n=1 Tax=Rhinatrema bivittatum TaxID=194408 RepID=UPI00112C66B4|nr:zinc finger protein 398-like isoform X2 [Rhinatrema bivittatum]